MANITLDNNTLYILIDAAKKTRKQVEITYKNEKGEIKTRTVEPVKFLANDGDTGVLTKDHLKKEWRHFKLRNIFHILITDHDYEMVKPEEIE